MIKYLPESWADNPIIEHSLRRSRSNWRFVAAILLSLLLYFPACSIISPFLILTANEPANFIEALPEVGQITFYATAIVLIVLVTLFAPVMSASAIAGERQRQTLDLLIITLIPVRSIVWGKLLASLLYTLILIAASTPVFLLCILLGGVAFVEILILIVLLLVTSVAFTTIGLYISSLGKTTTNATMLIFGLVLPGLFIVPPLLMLLLSLTVTVIDPRVENGPLLFYGWMLTLSVNPLTAAITSGIMYTESEGIILGSMGPPNYWIISPWLLFTAFYGLVTWLLIEATATRLDKLGR